MRRGDLDLDLDLFDDGDKGGGGDCVADLLGSSGGGDNDIRSLD